MEWVDEALWQRDPWDWEPWLVLSERLLEVGDPRGQLLVSEANGVLDTESAYAWIRQHEAGTRSLYDLVDAQPLLVPLLELAPTPLRLRPLSQVFAAADTAGSPRVVAYTGAILKAMLDWIRHAFGAFPMPDEDHRSLSQAHAADDYAEIDRAADPDLPWWDLPETYLEEYANAPGYLDAQGMAFYLPAMMGMHLRRILRPGPSEIIVMDSMLYRMDQGWTDPRFALLGCDQAAAVAAYAALLGDQELRDLWMVRTRMP